MKPHIVGIKIVCSTKLTRGQLEECIGDFIKEIDESNCTDMSFVEFMTKKQINECILSFNKRDKEK